ncbi:MAG: hypothetical protein U9R32_08775 [Bacteroidota bacterium]|nr:hypothetical protein [Bacteroidota bacterium]
MKTLKTLSVSITIILFVVLVFQRCSKENEAKTENLNAGITITTEDLQIESKIIGFKEKIAFVKENPFSKIGTDLIEADSAIWFLEATINYTYGNPEKRYKEVFYDKKNYTIDLNTNQLALMADVSQTYESMIENLSSFYHSINSPGKELFLVDLEKIEINNSQLKIELTAVVGNIGNETNPFGEEDYWQYGELLGQCEEFAGQGIGLDAAEKIQENIMANRPVCMPHPNCYYHYTDLEIIIVSGDKYINENDDTPNDNWLDYLMFYNTEEYGFDNEECLSPEKMNFYYNGMHTIIYDLEAALTTPPYKTFMECDIESLRITGTGNVIIEHKAYITYAIRHLVIRSIANEDLPLEL